VRIQEDRDNARNAAIFASLLMHVGFVGGMAYYDRNTPPEPNKPIELTFLADPIPGAPSEGDEVDVGAQQQQQPQPTKVAQRTPTPRTVQPPKRPVRPTQSQQPDATKFPERRDNAVAPSVQQPESATPPNQTSFAAWQAAKRKRLPGLSKQMSSMVGLGGEGRDFVRARGTEKCTPRSGRTPDLVYLLMDSSGSMNEAWRSQALTCAHQYVEAALASGALVSIGNFADRTTFTKPSRDPVAIGAMLRSRDNGRGTLLPSRQLGPLLDTYASLEADMVVLSDGGLVNYADVMHWYRYFLDLHEGNRGYLYTVGYEAPGEVTRAFEMSGFEIFVYRLL
jgi:hypothetical protein